MKVTMIGTANPCPQFERAGNSIAVEAGEDTSLVDCGPNATYRLLENDFNIIDMTDYFFTHHHMDHNVDFFHLTLMSSYLGRDELTVYGPEGTRNLVDGFHTAYGAHIQEATEYNGEPPAGLTEIDIVDVDDGFHYSGDGWEVSALPTEHAFDMAVYAYRFEEQGTGDSFVYSADTTPLDSVAEFALGADVLVHECNIAGQTEEHLDESEADARYFEPPYVDYLDWVTGSDTQDKLSDHYHSSPAEAGRIAEQAGVGRLVLTHLNPLRNPADIQREAAAEFSGDVVVAEDGMTVLP